MYKINITPFNVLVRMKDGTEKEVPYGLKDSIIEILFSPTLRLNGVNLLKQNTLAQKILDCKENELILENEEFERVKFAMDKIEGLGKNDVEMVRRVVEAQKVEVTTK